MKVLPRYLPGLCAVEFSSEPLLLLEGDWPADAASTDRYSLDHSIDARHAWIDEEASRIVDRLIHPATAANHICALHWGNDAALFAFLNALKLRYYLVRLLRLVAFFEERPELLSGSPLEFCGATAADADYGQVLQSIATAHGAEVAHSAQAAPLSCPLTSPPGQPRRYLRRAASVLNRTWDRWTPRGKATGRHVMLCGNPHLLDPLCTALKHQGARVSWLYRDLAARAWWRWRVAGVRQLTCDGRVSPARLHLPTQWPSIVARGIDLTAPIADWCLTRSAQVGEEQARHLDQLARYFCLERPEVVILDEDATPFARAVVAVARAHGVPTAIAQHGAPCVRFGFAPLAADKFFAWGDASARQLEAWGVSAEQIVVTGPARRETLISRMATVTVPPLAATAQTAKQKIVLLATRPPVDDRPDAVEFHLTGATFAGMLRMACIAVEKLARETNANLELVVKLHPRAGQHAETLAILNEFASLAPRIIVDAPLVDCLSNAACVLSCASSAGAEATLAGVPVIQLLPAGSAEIMPAADWGYLGTARLQSELDALLPMALARGWRRDEQALARVFGNGNGLAANAVATAALELATRQTGNCMGRAAA